MSKKCTFQNRFFLHVRIQSMLKNSSLIFLLTWSLAMLPSTSNAAKKIVPNPIPTQTVFVDPSQPPPSFPADSSFRSLMPSPKPQPSFGPDSSFRSLFPAPTPTSPSTSAPVATPTPAPTQNSVSGDYDSIRGGGDTPSSNASPSDQVQGFDSSLVPAEITFEPQSKVSASPPSQ